MNNREKIRRSREAAIRQSTYAGFTAEQWGIGRDASEVTFVTSTAVAGLAAMAMVIPGPHVALATAWFIRSTGVSVFSAGTYLGTKGSQKSAITAQEQAAFKQKVMELQTKMAARNVENQRKEQREREVARVREHDRHKKEVRERGFDSHADEKWVREVAWEHGCRGC